MPRYRVHYTATKIPDPRPEFEQVYPDPKQDEPRRSWTNVTARNEREARRFFLRDFPVGDPWMGRDPQITEVTLAPAPVYA